MNLNKYQQRSRQQNQLHLSQAAVEINAVSLRN